jgi:hypothetical protein
VRAYGKMDDAGLAKLTQELVALRTRFSDRYPDVASKKAEVESLTALVAQKPVVDRALPQLEQTNLTNRALVDGDSASLLRTPVLTIVASVRGQCLGGCGCAT